MKVEDIERIFKETVSRPENSIHLPFEKHARIGRKYDGDYIYSSKLICEYTPEQVLQQLQEIADEKEVDITNSEVLFILNHTRRYENNDSCPLLDRFIFSAYQRYIIQGIVENNEKELKNDTENNRLPLSKEGYEDL